MSIRLLPLLGLLACLGKSTSDDDDDDDGGGGVDADDDGYTDAAAGGDDCDDADPAIADGCPAYEVHWGDLHVHTGFSNDGCEDPDNWCLPTGDEPAETLLEQLQASGLSFAAVTDHAEWDGWTRYDPELSLDIWASAQDRVAEAREAGFLLLLGFELTADFGHRTVVLDALEACEDYRPTGDSNQDFKEVFGFEDYSEEVWDGLSDAQSFEDWMLAAASTCTEVGWRSWRHHPAYPIPKAAQWSRSDHRISTDTVVEIASEHGVSECSDLTLDGCDFRVDEGRHNPDGSIQTALTLGYPFGFVAGSDRHDAHSWEREQEPSYSSHFLDEDGDGDGDTPAQQLFDGAITGLLLAPGEELDAAAVFDAIDHRRTVAATWNFSGLQILAIGADGVAWWPGEDLDPGDYSLSVALDDPEVDSWSWELVDPSVPSLDSAGSFTLAAGEVRYLRIRAWIDGEEHRIWASPWFGG